MMGAVVVWWQERCPLTGGGAVCSGCRAEMVWWFGRLINATTWFERVNS